MFYVLGFNNGLIMIFTWITGEWVINTGKEISYTFVYPTSFISGGITVPLAIGTGDKVIFGSSSRSMSQWEIILRNVSSSNTTFHGMGIFVIGF